MNCAPFFLSTGSAFITFHKYLKLLNGFYYNNLFLHYLDSAKWHKLICKWYTFEMPARSTFDFLDGLAVCSLTALVCLPLGFYLGRRYEAEQQYLAAASQDSKHSLSTLRESRAWCIIKTLGWIALTIFTVWLCANFISLSWTLILHLRHWQLILVMIRHLFHHNRPLYLIKTLTRL